jgi:ATP-dependent helicase HrpA
VTLTLPLAALNQLPANRCEWLVPGLLKEKILALLKTLQQKYRHRLQPLDEFVTRFCDAGHELDEPLVRALTRAAEEHLAMKLPLDAFRTGELRAHLFMNFRLTDEHGGTLAISRNLLELRADYRDRVEQAYAAAEMTHEAAAGDLSGLTAWTFGALPELMEVKVGAGTTLGFPALVDMGESVRLTAFDTEEKARTEHRRGMARLFALQLAAQVKAIEKLPGLRELALQFMALGTEKELKEQLVAVTLERTCLMDPLPVEESAFATRREAARGRVLLVAQEILRLLGNLLTEHSALAKKLAGMQKAFPLAAADIGTQLAELMPKRFIVGTPFERLQHYPRYLKAIGLRLDKARSDPARDTRLMADWQALGKPWERERNAMLKSGQAGDAFLDEFRWLLEELRVALFAQELKTSSPVSVKRLQKMWDARLHR